MVIKPSQLVAARVINELKSMDGRNPMQVSGATITHKNNNCSLAAAVMNQGVKEAAEGLCD